MENAGNEVYRVSGIIRFPKGFLVCIGDRCLIIFWSSDVTLNVACELSQPMGKKEFFSTAKKVNKLCLI